MSFNDFRGGRGAPPINCPDDASRRRRISAHMGLEDSRALTVIGGRKGKKKIQ